MRWWPGVRAVTSADTSMQCTPYPAVALESKGTKRQLSKHSQHPSH